jgi:hypothetical protein
MIDFPMDGAPSNGCSNDNHFGAALHWSHMPRGRRPHHHSTVSAK